MTRNARTGWLLLVLVLLTGCVAPPYILQESLPVTYGALTVDPGQSWNQASKQLTPLSRDSSITWTQDGILLDRLMIIPGVADGESLLEEPADAAAFPTYRAGMLPNEVAELVESSVLKLLGEGDAVVNTSNLRPTRFGEVRGFMFEIEGIPADSPVLKGTVAAADYQGELYLMIYLAAEPYYHDKHRQAALAVIESARFGAPPAEA